MANETDHDKKVPNTSTKGKGPATHADAKSPSTSAGEEFTTPSSNPQPTSPERAPRPWPPNPPVRSILFKIDAILDSLDKDRMHGRRDPARIQFEELEHILQSNAAKNELGSNYNRYYEFIHRLKG